MVVGNASILGRPRVSAGDLNFIFMLDWRCRAMEVSLQVGLMDMQIKLRV